MPQGVSGTELTARAANRQIKIFPGARFGPGAEYDQYIRLNVGRRWSDALAEAIATLGELSGASSP